MNLNQITITASDVDRSLQFYLGLGLELIVDARPGYVRLVCPDGGSTFSISHRPDIEANSAITIYFETTVLDTTVQEPEDKPWLWRESELRDPDGHRIILYFAGENRINPPWKVKSDESN